MLLKNKNVLLLTSTNLTCNPRCLKEVILLKELGANLTVVAFNLHNWTNEMEVAINNKQDCVSFHYIETGKKDFFNWLFNTFLEKGAQLALPLLPKNIFCASIALSKRSWQLLRWTKSNNINPHLVIAHNPAAFYPAYRIAMENNIPFAIDVEDYHPGENSPAIAKKAVTILMKQLIPKTGYTSFASPLIKEHTDKLMNTHSSASFIVKNHFPASQFCYVEPQMDKKLKMVWFSQNIDFGRGLEELLVVYKKFSHLINLTLIGNPRQRFCNDYLMNQSEITIIKPLQGEVLNKMISQFDIGLAIEPGKDFNNRIALSNKILTYFQAGLYILASDTAAQKLFISEQPGHGICTSLSINELTNTFVEILQHSNYIKSMKRNRFKKASLFNWENESKELTKVWEKLLA